MKKVEMAKYLSFYFEKLIKNTWLLHTSLKLWKTNKFLFIFVPEFNFNIAGTLFQGIHENIVVYFSVFYIIILNVLINKALNILITLNSLINSLRRDVRCHWLRSIVSSFQLLPKSFFTKFPQVVVCIMVGIDKLYGPLIVYYFIHESDVQDGIPNINNLIRTSLPSWMFVLPPARRKSV